MHPAELLPRLLAGQFNNVRFTDVQRLLDACGFELRRVAGSHHIYFHARITELVNLQNVAGQAKPYQLRQVILIQRYGLEPEELL